MESCCNRAIVNSIFFLLLSFSFSVSDSLSIWRYIMLATLNAICAQCSQLVDLFPLFFSNIIWHDVRLVCVFMIWLFYADVHLQLPILPLFECVYVCVCNMNHTECGSNGKEHSTVSSRSSALPHTRPTATKNRIITTL